MPVIQEQNPLDVGAGAAGAYLQQRNQNSQLAQQLAMQKAWQQYQIDKSAQDRKDRLAQAAQQQSNWQQDFGLNKQRTDADVAHLSQADRISAAQEERTQQAFPLEQQLRQLQVKGQADTNEGRRLENQIKTIDLQIAKKYKVKLADLQVQQGEATLQSTRAGTDLTEAEAGYYRGGGSGGFGKGANATDVRTTLPPEAEELLQQVESGQTTPAMALLYAKRNPKLAPYANALTFVLSKPKGVKMPTAATAKTTAAGDTAGRAEAELPPDVQQKIGSLPQEAQSVLTTLFGQGMSTQQIMTLLDKSTKVDPELKNAIKGALTPAGPSMMDSMRNAWSGYINGLKTSGLGQ
jgi:hypothetical protein